MTDHNNKQNLLIEIGTEELPAQSVLPMANSLGSLLVSALAEASLLDDSAGGDGKSGADGKSGVDGQSGADGKPGADNRTCSVFATPRRLAVIVASVRASQPDQNVQRRGPAVSAAYDDDGNPTKAVMGFAKSCGVEVSDLGTLKTDKGEWLVYEAQQRGRDLSAVLSGVLPGIVKQIPMPKRMRWSDLPHEFLRPVTTFTVMHGAEVLPVELLGLTSSANILGHRFHHGGALTLTHCDHYEQTLASEGHVIPDFAKRRAMVVEQIHQVAKDAGGQVHPDDVLIDEVTALVEWPVALAGSFDTEFLAIPKEALIQTMEENQRYFALFDQRGNLMPGFVTVANLQSTCPESVKSGNERVIRPRFKDTMFFWDNDRRTPLADRRDALASVVFQKRLGTLLDKSERLESLAPTVASQMQLDATTSAHCAQAASLALCDLMTEIVGELPKMQGIAGRYLALEENLPAPVSTALEQQYYPLKSGGDLPQEPVAITLAICTKADLLTGIFGIGSKPTGAKDPFGLRRAALGLLRLLVERDVDIDLPELINASRVTFGDRLDTDFATDEVVAYILERAKSWYQEQGVPADVLDAILATGVTRPIDIHRRIHAVQAFRQSDAAVALSAANKRIHNILRKAEVTPPESPDDALLVEPAEQALAAAVSQVEADVAPLYQSSDYAAAMKITATLREPVDAFFNDVMVMVDDTQTRDNRLALLNRVGRVCCQTADLSRLQPDASE